MIKTLNKKWILYSREGTQDEFGNFFIEIQVNQLTVNYLVPVNRL